MTGVLIREAPISRAEFFHRLSIAAHGHTISESDDGVTIDDGRVLVRLSAKASSAGAKELLIASFYFDRMSDEEVRQFMEYYDNSTQMESIAGRQSTLGS